jgi:hypothetical protein
VAESDDTAPELEPALAELRQRLDEDLAAVMVAVASLTQTQADWRPAPERWSVGEVVHHLVLANRLFAFAVRKLVTRGKREGLAAPVGATRSWPRLRAIADASLSGPVRNPDNVTPRHGLPIDTLNNELIASHTAVAEQVPTLADLDLAALTLRHPLGFDLNLYRWADIAGAHERRHLVQIRAILAEPGFPW